MDVLVNCKYEKDSEKNVSHHIGNSTICIGENKCADQLRSNDQRLCFRFSDSTIPLLLKAFNSFLCLYRPVCVGPVRKQRCWFSQEAAHVLTPLSSMVIVFQNTQGQLTP